MSHIALAAGLLTVLPPGAEALALRALHATLQPPLVQHALSLAQLHAHKLQQDDPALASALAASSASPPDLSLPPPYLSSPSYHTTCHFGWFPPALLFFLPIVHTSGQAQLTWFPVIC